MLFNSPFFIFVFLPITLLFFFLAGSRGYHKSAIVWLVFTSLFFYGWWNPIYLGLIIFSIFFNFTLGSFLCMQFESSIRARRSILIFGLLINLGLLCYFKYMVFFTSTANILLGTNFNLQHIILPLAISFFTFQQIAYLVDVYAKQVREYNFLHYCLFVTFFPQLIAGPIVHHTEMMSQFGLRKIFHFNPGDMSVGASIFFIGLFKKVILADSVAQYATPVFNAAGHGVYLTLFEAWGGALAYTLQLYFDFSGYSDMAIGLARMFGIKLPLNFNSPYKANNIIEFWRCWHMTLSRFLRDYLYFPLGGNRKGRRRRYANLMITMLLGGLWHGAGWTFVIWGGLHGIYLIVNHGWHAFTKALQVNLGRGSRWGVCLARGITFFSVVIGWVYFRAASWQEASNMIHAMLGTHGISLPHALAALPWPNIWTKHFLSFDGMFYHEVFGGASSISAIVWVVPLLFIVWFTPSTQQWFAAHQPAIDSILKPSRLQWQPTGIWTLVIYIIAFTAIINLSNVSEFIYFQF